MLKFTLPFSLATAVLLSCCVGCDPDRAQEVDPSAASAPSTSTVPLRLWIVGQVSDAKLVERAWLTGSDQKVEIRTLTVDEFLAEQACNCDVAIYPSRLLGELIDRRWLTKLPGALTVPDEDAPQVPAGWIRQASYGRETWAVPLGASVPLVIVSPPAIDSASKAEDWDSLLKSLEIATPATPTVKFGEAAVDRAAVVDRFFAIVGGLSERTPDYGLLFELQTMRPRLTEPEFVRAAEILVRLAQQSSSEDSAGLSPMVADASRAWTWVQSQTQPAVAVLAPSLLTAEAAKATGGKALRMPAKWIGWNTGSGLNASLSANCRQSTRAAEMLKWLRSSETRQTLAPTICGIESASPIAGSDSSAWQASNLATELIAGADAPNEMRLPRAEDYRHALATNLIAILSGAKTIDEGLGAAAQAWQKITEEQGRVLQRSEYERSLGLVRE